MSGCGSPWLVATKSKGFQQVGQRAHEEYPEIEQHQPFLPPEIGASWKMRRSAGGLAALSAVEGLWYVCMYVMQCNAL